MLVYTPLHAKTNSYSTIADDQHHPPIDVANSCCTPSRERMASSKTRNKVMSPMPQSNDTSSREELEKIANEYTVLAYDLVWHQAEYDQAVVVLHKALEIQRSYLGKHHKDVGYTCNFIATAYWLQAKDWNKAMRYFLEARRIFCKIIHGDTKDMIAIGTTSPMLSAIDDRIHCILVRFQLSPEDIQRAKQAIDRTMAHELEGDRLKAQGLTQAAKEEYKRARKVAGVLRQLI